MDNNHTRPRRVVKPSTKAQESDDKCLNFLKSNISSNAKPAQRDNTAMSSHRSSMSHHSRSSSSSGSKVSSKSQTLLIQLAANAAAAEVEHDLGKEIDAIKLKANDLERTKQLKLAKAQLEAAEKVAANFQAEQVYFHESDKLSIPDIDPFDKVNDYIDRNLIEFECLTIIDSEKTPVPAVQTTNENKEEVSNRYISSDPHQQEIEVGTSFSSPHAHRDNSHKINTKLHVPSQNSASKFSYITPRKNSPSSAKAELDAYLEETQIESVNQMKRLSEKFHVSYHTTGNPPDADPALSSTPHSLFNVKKLHDETLSAVSATAEIEALRAAQLETTNQIKLLNKQLQASNLAASSQAGYVTSNVRKSTDVNNEESAHVPQPEPHIPENSFNANSATQPSFQHHYDIFSDYLYRRDLAADNLQLFNDDPANFRIWKTRISKVAELAKLPPDETLNLMTKKCESNSESREIVERISRIFISRPEKGLEEAWQRLKERFGTDDQICATLYEKLENLPIVKSDKELQYFADVIEEVYAASTDESLDGLSALDNPIILKPVISKLPADIISKWKTEAYNYKCRYNVVFPPFHFLIKFVQKMSRIRNDPSLSFNRETTIDSAFTFRTQIDTRTTTPRSRTVVEPSGTDNSHVTKPPVSNPPSRTNDPDQWQWQKVDVKVHCPIHDKPHPLKECRVFRRLPISERTQTLEHNKICTKCVSGYHDSKKCVAELNCKICSSRQHNASMHVGPPRRQQPDEREDPTASSSREEVHVQSRCTAVCGNNPNTNLSCAKTVLAKVYPEGQRQNAHSVYVIIDEMSNKSLATSELFDHFNIQTPEQLYSLHTCSGSFTTSGRRFSKFIIESWDGEIFGPLPSVTECEHISNGTNANEIPDPNKIRLHPHLHKVAAEMPPVMNNAHISLLLGRDAPQYLKVHEVINGKSHEPWAHRLMLGWTVMGTLCLDGAHVSNSVNVRTTTVTDPTTHPRPSSVQHCHKELKVKALSANTKPRPLHGNAHLPGQTVFETTQNDEQLSQSQENKHFIEIMDEGMYQNETANWEGPLPFRDKNPVLPCNRAQAEKRFWSLVKELLKKPEKKRDYFEFMGKLLQLHAELAIPELAKYFLYHFGTYHRRKKTLRAVFDSSGIHKGHSLNKSLLAGPNMVSNLKGVLIRFRLEIIAFIADIEQMFHSFHVIKEHRDYLHFLWFKNNDPNGPVAEYRMKVHVFGNSPSPSVAIYGLKKTADVYESEFGSDVKDTVYHNFYVDDLLKSMPDEASAIDLLKRVIAMLAKANLRLHKIASNSPAVMNAFPAEERAKDLRELDLSKDDIPLQSSLGVAWDLKSDCFTFRPNIDEFPDFTKRGISGVINGQFDPLGFAAPVTTTGKIHLRQMTSSKQQNRKLKWDDPLPENERAKFNKWYNSLSHLSEIHISRAYSNQSTSAAQRREIHVFSDASNDAIAACIFLKCIHEDNQITIAFVEGKSKLAPKAATSMPRLELCAAVLAVELYQEVLYELGLYIHDSIFYTDSKVVLGYIRNETRQFYVYVANRVEKIRRHTKPSSWTYIPTNLNPADCATRTFKTEDLDKSMWLRGPPFLFEIQKPTFDLDIDQCNPVEFDQDKEVKPAITCRTTRTQNAEQSNLLEIPCDRFNRFSEWTTVVNSVAVLVSAARTTTSKRKENAPIYNTTPNDDARKLIFRSVQHEAFASEIADIQNHGEVNESSPISNLNPVLLNGLLVVGGRLKNCDINKETIHPIILPKNHHISILLIRHYHESVYHQGRHITHGALRSHGLWIVGCRRTINTLIDDCVICRKLRGKFLTQMMSDLPRERTDVAPVFTHVGLDVFGPWKVVARRTRGGLAEDKRYALILVCMVVRAVHVEILENMTSSCFINALRRFLCIRGAARSLFSDQGTNFKGANNELKELYESPEVEQFLKSQNCQWTFNPPTASHMGGAWERLIGVCRNVINGILINPKYAHSLTHESLTTMMAEVCAVVNSRPITAVSSDPEDPDVLTPSQILTLKTQTLTAPPITNDTRKVWKLVQCFANEFWTKFKTQYLADLQERRKWRQVKRNVQIGDIVLMSNDTARTDWPVCRVIATKKSADNLVRSVTLKVPKRDSNMKVRMTTLDRPIAKLIMLIPNSTNGNE